MGLKQKTINPYRAVTGLIFRRFLWDLRPCSWISRSRVKRWRNTHVGEKAVILCNGPSLNRVDFDRLGGAGIFTFGLNKINLLFPKTAFRPSVIVAVNPYVLEQNADFYNQTKTPLFLDTAGRQWVRMAEHVHFLHSASLAGEFAEDCSVSVCQGYTVTYVAMQLAFHMGFSQVALVGCDHSFTTQGSANETVVAGRTDPNHFDPNYFANGVKWQLPDLARSELYYSIAKNIFEKNGRKIVNCTDGGELELFERLSLDGFLRL